MIGRGGTSALDMHFKGGGRPKHIIYCVLGSRRSSKYLGTYVSGLLDPAALHLTHSERPCKIVTPSAVALRAMARQAGILQDPGLASYPFQRAGGHGPSKCDVAVIPDAAKP